MIYELEDYDDRLPINQPKPLFIKMRPKISISNEFELDDMRLTPTQKDINLGQNTRFIEFLGTTPPDSKSRVGPNLVIEASSNPNIIIDAIDSIDEEPFTLETFQDLITMHSIKGLDFILARVVTIDPTDADRKYFSYYSAHHINKVLFTTNHNRGLLHRLSSKNPLNNMDIVGDVHYFCVKATDVVLDILKY